MLYYDRINISEGIDTNKKMHQKIVIFATIGIFQIKGLNFKSLQWGIIVALLIELENEAISLLQNVHLTEERGTL